MSGAPVIEARDARLTSGGANALHGLNLQTQGQRVLLVGCPVPLVTALGGALGRDSKATAGQLAAGSLKVLGQTLGSDGHRRICGFAPTPLAAPGDWTCHELLLWSARLRGSSSWQGAALAEQSLQRLNAGALARRQIRSLSIVEQRALSLAHALVGDPEVVVLQNPLDGLHDVNFETVLQLLGHATTGRAAIISTPHVHAAYPIARLARSATDLCVFRAGELLFSSQPGQLLTQARLYQLSVLRDGEALRGPLTDLGATLVGGPIHFSVELPPPLGTNDILGAAARADVPIVACVPLL